VSCPFNFVLCLVVWLNAMPQQSAMDATNPTHTSLEMIHYGESIDMLTSPRSVNNLMIQNTSLNYQEGMLDAPENINGMYLTVEQLSQSSIIHRCSRPLKNINLAPECRLQTSHLSKWSLLAQSRSAYVIAMETSTFSCCRMCTIHLISRPTCYPPMNSGDNIDYQLTSVMNHTLISMESSCPFIVALIVSTRSERLACNTCKCCQQSCGTDDSCMLATMHFAKCSAAFRCLASLIPPHATLVYEGEQRNYHLDILRVVPVLTNHFACCWRSDPEGRRPLAEPSGGAEGGRICENVSSGPCPSPGPGDWVFRNRGERARTHIRAPGVERAFVEERTLE
jgi:hypothetical protein